MFFEGMMLFVPQDDVKSVEIMADLQLTPTDFGAVGWYGGHAYGHESPVFCLSEDMLILPDLPESREYFVLLKSGNVPVGITCDEVENVDIREVHLDFQILHPMMHLEHSPIQYLVVYQTKIACVSSGERLVEYLANQSEIYQTARQADLA